MQAVWEWIERILKVAGIIGGLAAAAAVWVQLKDINRKETEKKIEEWQTTAVYNIIGSSALPIKLGELSLQYVSAAQKLPQEVPREKLDDSHLQFALLRLLQSNAIVEVGHGS
jgi:hypothetical protein